jgi:hypothetical protein
MLPSITRRRLGGLKFRATASLSIPIAQAADGFRRLRHAHRWEVAIGKALMTALPAAANVVWFESLAHAAKAAIDATAVV